MISLTRFLTVGVGASALLSCGALFASGCAAGSGTANGFQRASMMSDLSGLVWIGGDQFVAVHDAKADDEPRLVRVSVLTLPEDLDGVLWKSQSVAWEGSKSNDLESAARIPGTNRVLLVESGDSGKGSKRMFVAEVSGTRINVSDALEWPASICNIEATAMARIADQYVFLYAERNTPDDHCKPVDFCQTTIHWAPFDSDSLEFGEFKSARFENPDKQANRPLVGLDVSDDGTVFSVAAFDPETAGLPDPDNGPFTSSVWKIGHVALSRGVAELTLTQPELQGRLDGMKVESVAVRPDPNDPTALQLFVGTDDENYGGTLRLLPAADLTDVCP